MSKYLLLLLPLILCCSVTKTPSSLFTKEFIPPNCFKIDSTLFIDKTEITNVAWKEYQYWTMNIYGKESKEFLNILPDTTVWIGETILDTLLSEEYYQNPIFDNHPVVGVTQEQAHLYSKWRSDRVFSKLC